MLGKGVSRLVPVLIGLILSACSGTSPLPYREGAQFLDFGEPQKFACASFKNVAIQDNEVVILANDDTRAVQRRKGGENGSTRKVYRRRAGEDWVEIPIPAEDAQSLDLLHTSVVSHSDQILILAWEHFQHNKYRLNVVKRMKDSGASWESTPTDVVLEDWIHRQSVTAGNGGTAISMPRDKKKYQGVVSHDSGRTWTKIEGSFDLPWTLWSLRLFVTNEGEPNLFMSYTRGPNVARDFAHCRGLRGGELGPLEFEEKSLGVVAQDAENSDTIFRLFRERASTDATDEQTKSQESGRILLSISKDGGQTWGRPRTVVPKNLPGPLAVAGCGEVLVFCWEEKTGTMEYTYSYSASRDGGESWSKPNAIFTTPSEQRFEPFVIDGAVAFLSVSKERVRDFALRWAEL